MGQQQLLLLVLGIVIVGIAVVAGITAFTEGKDKADRDAASSDAMRLVSNLQAWKLKPVSSGGGASASGFTGASLSAIGVTVTNGNYVTPNGCYTLTAGTNAVVGVYKAASDCTGTGNKIADVTVSGSTSSAVAWAYAS